MKYTVSDKAVAYLTLFSGLTISAVAIYYSVAGLVSIFAAAAVPIIVMGAVLEISKLVATVWLKLNWKRAPKFIRSYLLAAIAVLMFITSMGIFGFLSKAHSDQSLISGDVQSKLAIYDQKIQTAKENIEADRRQLKQMDEAVDQVMARSKDERGANNANTIRKSQQRDRAALAKSIESNQKLIATLNDEAAPIRAEIRKVEAEVGPIKYIAKFVYGDNPDANILEKAVTWVIIIIVIVFDPLAVILLLASQYSFQWFRQQAEGDSLDTESVTNIVDEDTTVTQTEEGDSPLEPEPVVDEQPLTVTQPLTAAEVTWPTIQEPTIAVDTKPVFPRHNIKEYSVIEDLDIPVLENEELWSQRVIDEDDDEEYLNEPDHVKTSKSAWKADHPNDSLKHQRRLYEQGLIPELPWNLPPYTLTAVDDESAEAAAEAAKWAMEQLERPGDYLQPHEAPVSWMEHDENNKQVKKTTDDTYHQNEEQSEKTLWQRIQDAKK